MGESAHTWVIEGEVRPYNFDITNDVLEGRIAEHDHKKSGQILADLFIS